MSGSVRLDRRRSLCRLASASMVTWVTSRVIAATALVGDAINVAAVNAPARREDEPVKRFGIVGVVRDGRVGGDLGCVVHAAQHEVGVVVKKLIGIVVGVRFGKPDREAPPRLAALVPRLDLAYFDAGIGEAKRLGQVVPVRGAQEVRHLDPIPAGGCGIERRER